MSSAAQYLRKHKLQRPGTLVRVSAEKAKKPARMDNFRIEVAVPMGLDAEHRKGIEQAVHLCLIHNTLQHRPQIAIEVKSAAMAEQVQS